MSGGTIELDGDTLIAPKCVDSHAPNPAVDLRLGKVSGVTELQKSLFEFAQGPSEPGKMARQGRAQCPRAAPAGFQDGPELPDVQQAAVVRLGQRPS